MRRVVTLFALLVFILPVFAVECPPGFNWQRMSGVGCVQDDCAAKGGGYTYTQECWCGERTRACFEAVNYSGFDANLCKPFCPVSKFIGCADANGKCPNDQPVKPVKPTQEYCDSYCKSYHGPYAKAEVLSDSCNCGCKEGYTDKNNEILLCQPSKATCDKYCKEYHGGDKIHGDSAYGTVMGMDCDCHCSTGYYADATLVCVKIPTKPQKNLTCQEVCNKTIGEGALALGTYPNCRCDCKGGYTKHNVYDKEWKVVCEKIKCPRNSSFNEEKGKCLCDQGFYMELVDGLCVPLSKPKFCGNKTCDTKVDPQYLENCYSCPEDCSCEPGQICNPKHAITYEESYGILNGCVNTIAEIVDIGCADGSGVPPVYVHRENQPGDAQIRGQRGTKLAVGDTITLSKVGESERVLCNKPYITLQWGDVRGMMMLEELPSGIVNIEKDAVSSGWPAGIGVKGVGGLLWRIFGIVRSVGTSVPSAALSWGSSTAGGKDTVKVYVKSNIIINQSVSAVNVYTLEGEPVVEYKGKNTTVNKGMKVTVSAGSVSTPTNFTASDVGDWYLRIPEPPAEENANANGSSNTTPDLSGITSQLKNTCCGSTAMIGMLLVLAAWGEKRRR